MIVWLASYPRSGNTFLRVLLNSCFDIQTYSLYNDANDIAVHSQTKKIVGHLDLPNSFDLDAMRQEDIIYYIKTHELPNLSDTDKVIYIMRDGAVALHSYFQYRKKYTNSLASFENLIIGNVLFGSWSDHVRAWDPLRRENVLFLKFEDVVTNTVEAIDSLRDFLTLTPITYDYPQFHELKQKNSDFFRSGRTHENVFSFEQLVLFWLYHEQVMSEYGYGEAPESTLKYVRDSSFKTIVNSISVHTDLQSQLKFQSRNLEQAQLMFSSLEKENDKIVRVTKEQREKIKYLNRQLSSISELLDSSKAISLIERTRVISRLRALLKGDL